MGILSGKTVKFHNEFVLRMIERLETLSHVSLDTICFPNRNRNSVKSDKSLKHAARPIYTIEFFIVLIKLDELRREKLEYFLTFEPRPFMTTCSGVICLTITLEFFVVL